MPVLNINLTDNAVARLRAVMEANGIIKPEATPQEAEEAVRMFVVNELKRTVMHYEMRAMNITEPEIT